MAQTQQTKKVAVLHVVAPARFGGLETVVRSLAAAQLRAGDQVHVWTILEEGQDAVHPFLASLKAAGIPTRVASLPGRAYLREQRELIAVCRELRPDVVHTHGARVDVVDGPAARRAGLPTVSTVHGFTGGGLKNWVYEYLQQRSLRRATAVVAVSRPLQEQLGRNVPPERLTFIPNAWDGTVPSAGRTEARRALGLPKAGFVAGWIGRLGEEKGPDLFLDALALIPSGVRAGVIGDGRLRPALQAQAERLGIADRITWCGAVAGAGQWLAAFDVFVLSSRTEGTPVVLFESIAARVPIVATTVGGVPDVISETEAVLVPPGDPSALAGAIAGVQADPQAAARRAGAAMTRLETVYAPAAWARRYDAVYRKAMSSGGGTGR